MTLTGAGTPHATLVASIWLSAACALILGPSYALLFALQGRQVLQAGDAETDFPLGQVAEAEETVERVVYPSRK